MKFLVDQQLPRALVARLKSAGHEAWHVRDLGLELATDRELWREAANRGATLISKDEDFSVIVRIDEGPPVIWVRMGNCANAILLTRFATDLPKMVAEIEAGALLIEVR